MKLQAIQGDITRLDVDAIALETMKAFPAADTSLREVTFCCFSADDLALYRSVLG